MKTIKEITIHLKDGNTITHNGKQLSYCEHSFAYIVNGIKTISIQDALKELWN